MQRQQKRKLEAVGNTASPQPLDYSLVPKYGGRISAQQVDSHDSDVMRIACVVIGVLVPTWLVMRNGIGFMEVVILLILVLAGFSVGMMCANLLERHWRSIRRRPSLFSSHNALVNIDADGFSIEGLGIIPWTEVSGCHGIADSDMSTVVYIQRYGKIILHELPSILEPVINYYLNRNRASDRLSQ